MIYKPPVKTPLTIVQALRAMKAALTKHLGEEPPKETILLALAHAALETGELKSMWNNNWGNIKAMGDYSGEFTCIELNEVLNGKLVWFHPTGEMVGKNGPIKEPRFEVPPGHPQTRMRSYETPELGASDYVAFLSKRSRYAKAWAQLLTGRPDEYVHELRSAKYFTANEELYLRGVKWRMGIYRAKMSEAFS